MNCTAAVLSLLFLAPCDSGAGGHQAVSAAVTHDARPATDVERDVNRKPAEVISFFGIEPGMTVLEVFSGGGYYTQILDSVVGPGGEVIAHNNQAYMNYIGEEFDGRFAAGLDQARGVQRAQAGSTGARR